MAIDMQTLQTIRRNVSMLPFANDGNEIITLTTATTDQLLSDIVVSDIPAGATVTHVVCVLRERALNNTSASVNAVNGDISLKIKKDAGSWGVDDVLLLTIPDNFLSTAATTKEGGIPIRSADIDVSDVVNENGTYNLIFDGNCFVDENDLELIDVILDMEVYFTA